MARGRCGFEPLDRRKERSADKADRRNMQKSLRSGHPKTYRTTCAPQGSVAPSPKGLGSVI
jgi:hypothetical protein